MKNSRNRPILIILLLLFSVLCIVVRCSSNNSTTPAASTKDNVSKVISKLRIKLPRITFWRRTSSNFNPSSKDYWISVGFLCLFGIIVTIVAILFALLWTPLRAAGLIGGHEPMRGFCCGTERKAKYPLYESIGMKAFFALFLLLTIGACISGIMGNVRFNRHFRTATRSLRFTILETLNRTAQVYVTLSDAGIIDSSNPEFQTQIQALNESDTAVDTIVREVGRLNVLRYYALFVVLIAVVIAHVLGLMSGIFHIKTFSEYASKVAWYTLVAVWFLYTAHFALLVVMGDACSDLDTYVTTGKSPVQSSNGLYNTALTYLDLIYNCTTNGTTFLDTLQITNDQVESLLDQYNTFLFQLDPEQREYNYTLETMEEGKELDWVKDDPQIEDSVTAVVVQIQKIEDTRIRLNELRQCKYISEGYTSMRNASCAGLLYSTNILWISFLILAVLMTVTAFMTNLAYKRFRKRAYIRRFPKHKQETYAVLVHI